MIFNSNIFLYCFLPLTIMLYTFSRVVLKKTQISNVVLLVLSLLFYAWGSGRYFFVLIVSILANYSFARLLNKDKSKKILILSVMFNLCALLWFKYMNFIFANIYAIFNVAFDQLYEVPFQIYLPIGISFFTFQAMSYVIDVYRDKVQCQKNIFKLALYISFFPQLIAGPIVRYQHVAEDIDKRKVTFEDIYYGAGRFCFGLAKKVLVADVLGKSVDVVFALEFSNLSTPIAWLGLILYSMQIYFDFSGYSDMAIGMARVFGFHFAENFNLPYISKTVTEFWKRWHMSLSTFFMDYVYIPLGGNRKGHVRTYINLCIVFLLCGLWHGASWNFVVWGGYYGVILVIERILKNKFSFQMKGIFGNLITLFLIMIGWLIFRSNSLEYAFKYLLVLMGESHLSGFQYYKFEYYFNSQVVLTAIFATIVSIVPFRALRIKFTTCSDSIVMGNKASLIYGATALLCLFLSMIYLSNATFNAFIYFQF